MTLGEKLKETRKQADLSQAQLSEKLGVSRSAVAKWETDNGIPDVDNLKLISKLLNVSVDYLLDDGEAIVEAMMREPYDSSKYGKGSKRKRKDRAVKGKFPDAIIHPLLGEEKLTKGEKIVDNVLGITVASFGIPQIIHSINHADKQFYLVEQGNKQFLVTVTDEWIEIRHFVKRMDDKTFEIGNWKFTKCAYEIK